MSDGGRANPEIFLFLSVDVIGSTQLKYNTHKTINWYNSFREFYITFPDEFRAQLSIEYKYRKLQYKKDNLIEWKHEGDEIILFLKITQKNEVPCILTAFKKTLEDWVQSDSPDKLKIKGAAWIAQTPFIDRKFIEDNSGRMIDFIGPSIDCGFRLGKYASQTEIAVSIEVVDLCNKYESLQTSIFYKTSENLKGVFGNDIKYPLFILKLTQDKDSKEFRHLLKHCDGENLESYIKEYYEELGKVYFAMVSRISQDIPDYLETKIELSKGVIAKDSKIKPQKDAKEADISDENANTENFQKVKEGISNIVRE